MKGKECQRRKKARVKSWSFDGVVSIGMVVLPAWSDRCG